MSRVGAVRRRGRRSWLIALSSAPLIAAGALVACSGDEVIAPLPAAPPDAPLCKEDSESPSVDGAFSPNTDWLWQAGYGVFVHFLPGMNDITADGADDWNASVDAFDAESFAEQVASTGAGYVILTTGQDSGFLCAPNATYDAYVGPGRTSKRDLPADVARALKTRGIKLMLYAAAAAPSADTAAANALGSSVLSSDEFNYLLTPLVRCRWSSAVQEWSDRYREDVAGWWFDGAYAWVGFDETYAIAFAKAARHGNAKALVSFDPFPDSDIETQPRFLPEDYTAGELNLLPPASSYPYPNSRWTSQHAQWHGLTFLGAYWGSPEVAPLDPDQQIRDPLHPIVAKNYIVDVNERGGVVTLDMAIHRNGAFAPEQLAIMQGIKASIRDARTVPHVDRSATATSEALDASAAAAIDGDVSTAWRSEIGDPLPQSITYALLPGSGPPLPVTRLRYLPPNGATEDGTITGYNVYTSTDGVAFTLAKTGTWADDSGEKIVELDGALATHVRLEATSGHGGFAGAANLNVEYAAPLN